MRELTIWDCPLHWGQGCRPKPFSPGTLPGTFFYLGAVYHSRIHESTPARSSVSGWILLTPIRTSRRTTLSETRAPSRSNSLYPTPWASPCPRETRNPPDRSGGHSRSDRTAPRSQQGLSIYANMWHLHNGETRRPGAGLPPSGNQPTRSSGGSIIKRGDALGIVHQVARQARDIRRLLGSRARRRIM